MTIELETLARLEAPTEVYEHLVGSPAFKAAGTGEPRSAGSIPVHLRQQFTGNYLLVTISATPWGSIAAAGGLNLSTSTPSLGSIGFVRTQALPAVILAEGTAVSNSAATARWATGNPTRYPAKSMGSSCYPDGLQSRLKGSVVLLF